jgi:hypothetical protein
MSRAFAASRNADAFRDAVTAILNGTGCRQAKVRRYLLTGGLPMTDLGWTIIMSGVVVCFVFLVRELVLIDQCREAHEQKTETGS